MPRPNKHTHYPIGVAMRIACGSLGLSLEQFWNTTPTELHAYCYMRHGVEGECHPPTKVELDSLRRQFPDTL